VDEIGRVVSVGDGIARVYGLNEIKGGLTSERKIELDAFLKEKAKTYIL
jgi:F0F1-type ATP synthase alpha subunit